VFFIYQKSKKVGEIARCVAFSNGSGGIVLFGIKDDGKNLWLKQSAFKIIEKEKILRGNGRFECETYFIIRVIGLKKSKTMYG